MDKVRWRSYWVTYPLWAVTCAALFLALRSADDPSRPSGRVTPESAKAKALAHLSGFDNEQFGRYQVIDAAFYRDVQRNEKIWIVVCDESPRSALKRAVVVDLDANDGSVIRTRRPAGVVPEEFAIP